MLRCGRSIALAHAVTIAVVVVLPAGAARSSEPSIGLRPDNAGPEYARAAAEAGADGVHLQLYWSQSEPHPGQFDWSQFEAGVAHFQAVGLPIGSVRVVAAPDWAVAGGACGPKFCPPTREHYEAFRDFTTTTVARYGPGTPTNVPRFILWNEPDLPGKWGGKSYEDGSYRRYSDLLGAFYRGAIEANPDVSVDAGEVMAGGSVEPRTWVKGFTRYNTKRNRNDHYEVLRIHGYSRDGEELAEKIRDHQRLSGVTRLGVSEFAWAVGDPGHEVPSGGFKCARSAEEQAEKLRSAVRAVRRHTAGVDWLVWLAAVDKLQEDKNRRCVDGSDYYDESVRDQVNPWGLFRRAPDGSFDPLDPRPIVDVFRRQAAR